MASNAESLAIPPDDAAIAVQQDDRNNDHRPTQTRISIRIPSSLSVCLAVGQLKKCPVLSEEKAQFDTLIAESMSKRLHEGLARK